MMRVHSTCANGANAIPVPGCPFFAASGPSMLMPRMTLIASCSRSVSTPLAVIIATLPTDRGRQQGSCLCSILEQKDRSCEPVEEAPVADRTDLACAEHSRSGAAVDVRVDDLR